MNFLLWMVIICLLIIVVECSYDGSGGDFKDLSESSRLSVLKQLKDAFKMNQAISTTTDADHFRSKLKQFQNRLILLRNYNCSSTSQYNYDDTTVGMPPIDRHKYLLKSILLNNSSKWQSVIADWRTYDRSLQNASMPKEILNGQLKLIVKELNQICLDADLLSDLFFFESYGGGIDQTTRNEYLYQIILSQLDNYGCNFCDEHPQIKGSTVTATQTWGYGILLVTIISASSLCGALVIPFSKKVFYKKILMFLIAVAVGSLAGSGFLHLIPQAFGITDDDKYSANHNYVWKGLVIMGGVYLFYVVEKILKLMIQNRKAQKRNHNRLSELDTSIKTNDEDEAEEKEDESDGLGINSNSNSNNNASSKPMLIDDKQHVLQSIAYVKTREPPVDLSVEMRTRVNQDILAQNERNNNDLGTETGKRKVGGDYDRSSSGVGHVHSHGFVENLSTVEPVAWMIIFGDGLHNFIDGLSIGAAFTDSILKGISISLAVICEEFPHELGDFAILINAGMTFKTALLFNFLSACSCYLGLACGIVLGDNLNANQWIYAIAGGMFLYISLCDMIPELNELGDEIEKDFHDKAPAFISQKDEAKRLSSSARPLSHRRRPRPAFNLKLKLKIMIIQNIGIIVGFSFMFIMAIYSGEISLGKT